MCTESIYCSTLSKWQSSWILSLFNKKWMTYKISLKLIIRRISVSNPCFYHNLKDRLVYNAIQCNAKRNKMVYSSRLWDNVIDISRQHCVSKLNCFSKNKNMEHIMYNFLWTTTYIDMTFVPKYGLKRFHRPVLLIHLINIANSHGTEPYHGVMLMIGQADTKQLKILKMIYHPLYGMNNYVLIWGWLAITWPSHSI